ncbi:uncharacterized protein G2W53_038337 [Senna tora]|uniref:Uncharacterized protein n=1 Tax=Senna tora TaxID=362788 RepID=A0A834SMC6_9FABA|nr:uncharacterized protein G2W53_038337 [Senna tora]
MGGGDESVRVDKTDRVWKD